MQMRVLSAEDVRRVVPMAQAVDAVTAAFRDLSAGQAVMPPRVRMTAGEAGRCVLVMPAFLPARAYISVKALSFFPDNPERGLPLIQAVVLVFDAASGAPCALMDGGALTAIRTGAASGAATRLMAREGARTVAVIGAGVQAVPQIEAVACVRPIARAWVFDCDAGKARRCQEALAARLDIPVSVAADAAEAVKEADIVCTVTTARTPVVREADLAPGVHINAAGAFSPAVREIPGETVARARVIVDHREAAREEAGDILLAVREGRIGADHVLGELGEVAAGKVIARRSDGDVTLFKSVGLGVQDTAVAALALANAARLGVGTVVDI